MPTLIAIAVTCWACAAIATPRKPLPGDEVQELVYSRLLGRQQRLALLALLATVVALFALVGALARHANTDVGSILQPTNYPVSGISQYVAGPGGTWAVVRIQPDGTTIITDYISGPPPIDSTTLDR